MPNDSSSSPPMDARLILSPKATASQRLEEATQSFLAVRKEAKKRKKQQAESRLSCEERLRLKLFAAIEKQSLKKLRQAIATGMELNFVALHHHKSWWSVFWRLASETSVKLNTVTLGQPKLWSPLAFACACAWTEGVRELVQAGARESLSLSWWASHNEKDRHDDGDCVETLSMHALDRSIFKRLFNSEPKEEKSMRQALVKDAFSNEWFLEIVQSEAVAWLDPTSMIVLEQKLFEQGLGDAQRARVLASYWRQNPQALDRHQGWRMRSILSRDGLKTLKALSQTGCFEDLLNAHCNLHLCDFKRIKGKKGSYEKMFNVFQEFQSEWHALAPFSQPHRVISTQTGEWDISVEEAVPLWVGAIILKASNCLKAMGLLPELMQDTMSRPHRRAWLALSPFQKTIREAQRQGAQLEIFVTPTGDTPLHFACAAGASNNRILKVAKLCPQWIDMRDTQGRTPLQCIPDHRREVLSPELIAALEELSLSITLGLRDDQGEILRDEKKQPSQASEDSSVQTVTESEESGARSKSRRL